MHADVVPTFAACCLAGLLLAASAAPMPQRQSASSASPRHVIIGDSADERAIDAYAVGNGPHGVLILGGIHGGYEANTSWLVWELLAYFEAEPTTVPDALTLWFVPAVNPDGLARGTRELANGIDPNRNWPTLDWSADTFGPGAVLLLGGGGAEPLSESETLALATWIEWTSPVVIVSYHSAAGLVMGGPIASWTGLLGAYQSATGYAAGNWTAYPVTGDFAQWAEARGIPSIEVELTDHVNPEVERNLAGLQAMLELLDWLLGGGGDAEPSGQDGRSRPYDERVLVSLLRVGGL
jgi:murein peptide amidase A